MLNYSDNTQGKSRIHNDSTAESPMGSEKICIFDRIPGKALEILEHHGTPKSCAVITNNPCPDYLTDLLAREPAALLANGEGFDQALKALEIVATGGRVISLPSNSPPVLTPSERLVLRAITRAQCDKRIARELGISDGTVRKRVSEMLDKLGLENRMQLGYYYLGLWSFLDAYRDRMPVHSGEHLWGPGGTNAPFGPGPLATNLEVFEPTSAHGHSRAPQAGSSPGGFMIREVNDNEALEVTGGWVPTIPPYRNPEFRDVPPAKPRLPVIDRNPIPLYPTMPLWKMKVV
jgi:DNA-binding CsgD family transcriptional regulator